MENKRNIFVCYTFSFCLNTSVLWLAYFSVHEARTCTLRLSRFRAVHVGNLTESDRRFTMAKGTANKPNTPGSVNKATLVRQLWGSRMPLLMALCNLMISTPTNLLCQQIEQLNALCQNGLKRPSESFSKRTKHDLTEFALCSGICTTPRTESKASSRIPWLRLHRPLNT